MLLLAVLLLVGFWLWLSGPGGQRPTVAIVSERSAGMIRFAPPKDDPGVEALRQAMKARLQADMRRGDGLPRPMRFALSAVATRLVPTEFTISWEEPGAGEVPVPIVAFNPGGYTRLLRLFVSLLVPDRGEAWSSPSYRGGRIYRLHATSYVAFLGGTGLFTESERVLLRGIDRLLEAEREAPPPMGRIGVPRPPDGAWDVTGWFVDGAELARGLPENEEAGTAGHRLAHALATVGPLAFGADLRTADRLTGTAWIEVPSAADAARLVETLRRDVAEAFGLDATVTLRTRGTRVEVDLDAVAVADSMFGSR